MISSCNSESIEALLDGRFIEPIYLTTESVIPTDLYTLEVNIKQPFHWASQADKARIIISDESDQLLPILTIKQTSDTRLIISTSMQTPSQRYQLTIQNLVGKNKEITPDGGLIATFQGSGNIPYFELIGSSTIVSHTPFVFTIQVKNSADQRILPQYNQSLSWNWVGEGTFTILDEGEWEQGERIVQAVYETDIAGGETESISISVKQDTNGLISGSLNDITVMGRIRLDHFELQAPSSTPPGGYFDLEIRAIGDDNNVFTSYSGTVQLESISLLEQPGELNINQVDSFVDGIATIQLVLDDVGQSFRIFATDDTDPLIQGVSEPIKVGYGVGSNFLLSLLALPFPHVNGIRLSWTPIKGPTNFLIYRKEDGSGSDFQLLDTAIATRSFYFDDTADANTIYIYKLEANHVDIGTLTEAVSAPVSYSTCNNVTSISSNTVWTKEEGPYCVDLGFFVPFGFELQIEPGVVILLGPSAAFQADGMIKILGTADEPVIFTSSKSSPEPGDWWTIEYLSPSPDTIFDGDTYQSGSILQHAVIEYAEFGARFTDTSLFIDGCIFRNNGDSTTGGIDIDTNTSSEKFVIQNCHFEKNMGTEVGAINAEGTEQSDILIQGCTFLKNEGTGVSTHSAGAIYSSHNATRIDENYFYLNTTDQMGGAIRMDGTDASITNNLFRENTAIIAGGAIYSETGTNKTIAYNEFYDNEAEKGGAIALYTAGSNTVNNNRFISNRSTTNGGAIYLDGENNQIQDNHFELSQADEGGALDMNSMNNVCLRNTFVNNQASWAGAVLTRVNNEITNCWFEENQASSGGAIVAEFGGLTGSGNTFVRNTANFNSTGSGGAIYFSQGQNVDFHHCYFKENAAIDNGGAIYLSGVFSSSEIGRAHV